MPLLFFLVVCLVLWTVARTDHAELPPDLTLVVRVRDTAPVLEMILREAEQAGIGHLTVVDEGSTDGSDRIAALWARRHEGVRVCRTFRDDALGTSVLILDLRRPEDAGAAERALRWLGTMADR